MTLPKSKVGVGLPDIRKNHLACHLARIVDWNIHLHTKDWVSLVQSFTEAHLGSLPWIAPHAGPEVIKKHLLLAATLETFVSSCKALHLSSVFSPRTPISQNPDFLPGCHTSLLKAQWADVGPTAGQFFCNGKVCVTT